ncbi:MAG: hypothetical protein JWP59_2797 [Massilia sp.]|nr:hypothetical protein [Massilia sp.]
MKPSLHLKVWILLGYVVLCTALVLLEQLSDAPPPYDPAIGSGAAEQIN